MNWLSLFAGLLLLAIGLVHTILGELLIFKNLRERSFVPNRELPPLRERHIRVLWASWHLTTLFGWGHAVVAVQLAFPETTAHANVHQIIAVAAFSGSVLVAAATQGKHPGWVGLLIAASLCWFA